MVKLGAFGEGKWVTEGEKKEEFSRLKLREITYLLNLEHMHALFRNKK